MAMLLQRALVEEGPVEGGQEMHLEFLVGETDAVGMYGSLQVTAVAEMPTMRMSLGRRLHEKQVINELLAYLLFFLIIKHHLLMLVCEKR